MLTQSQIDAIAEAVLQSMRPASTPEKNKPFSVGRTPQENTGTASGHLAGAAMHRRGEKDSDRPVEASEVVPMDASFMMEKFPDEPVSEKTAWQMTRVWWISHRRKSKPSLCWIM